MGLRRNSRENGLKFLFQQEFLSESDPGANFTNFRTHFITTEDNDIDFIERTTSYVIENKKSLDESITSLSTNWKIDRIALVDLLLLRLGMAEIKLKITPPKVVIDEILEIAKVYSSKDSVSFINGLLDQWTKEIYEQSELPE